MEPVKLRRSGRYSPLEMVTDDILGRILHMATSSLKYLYRVRTVCKRWQQMLDSADWRYTPHDVGGRHSCIVKSTFMNGEDKNWRTLADRGLIWRQSEFFCSLDEKWVVLPRKSVLSRHWSVVSSEGGLLCYQNASDWKQLCIDNPLKKLGFLMLPPIADHQSSVQRQSWKRVDTGYGETVRLIVKRNPDELKVVLTVLPASRRREVYSAVFDSTDMRWTMYSRATNQIVIDPSTPTFLLDNVIYFRTQRPPGHINVDIPVTTVTFVRFHTVSGLWDETTIFRLPCFAEMPLSFFQRDDSVYLIGTEVGTHDIIVWQLDCSVQHFLHRSDFVFKVRSTMPRSFMNPDTPFSVRRLRRWHYFPSSQRDHSICMVSNLEWITHDMTTGLWEKVKAFVSGTTAIEFQRRSANYRLCGFSWVPTVSPLMIAGLEL